MFTSKFFQCNFTIFAIALLVLAGCKTETTTTTTGAYQVTYIASDTNSFGNNVLLDPNLKNAWGIAIGSSGNFWIAANHSGVDVVYDANGNQIVSPVKIPSRDSIAGGKPTGMIFNPSATDFQGYHFIMAGEDGSLSGWLSGTSAALIYKNPSGNAIYKGIALAKDGANSYLYVTNFKERKVEVFNTNFTLSPRTGNFDDATIPADYGPFGITAVGDKLYVTYAKHKAPDNEDDQSGATNGYVNIFNTDGTLYKHFTSGGSLNSPWGVAQASDDFGTFKGDILIGNFGDGAINAYDANGGFLGQLKDNNGNVIKIDGLWAIIFSSNGNLDKNTLYFAAGPGGEEHGSFGRIQFK